MILQPDSSKTSHFLSFKFFLPLSSFLKKSKKKFGERERWGWRVEGINFASDFFKWRKREEEKKDEDFEWPVCYSCLSTGHSINQIRTMIDEESSR